MPQYVGQRTFPEGRHISVMDAGAERFDQITPVRVLNPYFYA